MGKINHTLMQNGKTVFRFNQNERTKAVTVELAEPQAEKLGQLLSSISNHTPNPKDDAADHLYVMLLEVLDL
jgi:hypothetical protein